MDGITIGIITVGVVSFGGAIYAAYRGYKLRKSIMLINAKIQITAHSIDLLEKEIKALENEKKLDKK
jgi:cell division protein FtsL